jgi:hypothetical protein
MLMIVWNPRGFYLINIFEKGCKFNATHYVTEILSPLSDWPASDGPENDRKLIMHADTARPHAARLSVEFFEDNRMKTAPHPPHSPHITPSDFYFSGMSKDVWPVAHSWIQKSFCSSSRSSRQHRKVTLQAVFLEWMDRLRKRIQTNDQYTE